MSSSELDFSQLIRELCKDFIGRQWLFEQVNDLLKSSDAKYFVVSGEPGIGKSAVAARLVQQEKTHAHHFCRGQEGTTLDPIAFVRSLSHQLIRNVPELGRHVIEQEQVRISVKVNVGEASSSQIYGVYVDEFVVKTRDAKEAFRCLITNPLKDWAKSRLNSEPVVLLLVDGLDEAMKLEHHPNIFDLIEQARDLPEAVRWILTSRPGEHLNNLPGAHLLLSEDSSENQSDVRNYGDAFLDEPAVAMAVAEQKLDRSVYLDHLVRRSEGNFLYLRLVFGQLRRKANAGKPLTTPAEFPTGLEDLYREFLNRVTRSKSRDYWREFFRPVLSVLAVAGDALDFEELCRLSGASPQSVNDVLSELAELLDSGSEGNGPYRFYHASFSDFMTDRFRSRKFWIDPVEYHRAIADLYLTNFGGNWKSCSDYGLRFLAHHLTSSGRHSELVRLLISDSSWVEAKVQRLGQGPFRDDLEIAADTFNDPVSVPDALVLAQLWILKPVADALSSAYSDSILDAMLALGHEEEAVNQASSRTDPQRRFTGLKLLLSLKTAVNGPSSRLFIKTLIAADEIGDNQQRAEAVSETVAILNPAERWDEILKAVRSLEPVRTRAEALKALAAWLYKSQDARTVQIRQEALETTRSISVPERRAWLLKELAWINAGEESFQSTLLEACDTAKEIVSADQRAMYFLELAREITDQQKSGTREVLMLAVTAAGEISDPAEKTRILHQVAVAQIDLGDNRAGTTLDDAVSASAKIISVPRRAELQEEIACSLGDAGLFGPGVKLAQKISYDRYAEIIKLGTSVVTMPGDISADDHQATALHRLSQALIAVGKHKEAIETALRIGNIFYRDMSLKEIALQLVEQGALATAQQAACAIDVEAFSREGTEKADAHPHFDAFFEAPMPWGRAEALDAVLNACLKQGEVIKALMLLSKYDEDLPWSRAVTITAEALLGVSEIKINPAAISSDDERLICQMANSRLLVDEERESALLQVAVETFCAELGLRSDILLGLSALLRAVSSATALEDMADKAEALAGVTRLTVNLPLGVGSSVNLQGEDLFEPAIDSVYLLLQERDEVRVAKNVCRALVRANRIEIADRLVKKLEAHIRPEVSEIVVMELLDAGRDDDALRLAREYGEDVVLEQVISALIQTGRFADALKEISRIKNQEIGSNLLRSLVEAFRDEGKFGQALQAVRGIHKPLTKARAILGLARAWLEAGNMNFTKVYGEALVAVTEMQSDDACYHSLEVITEKLLELGCGNRALSLNRRIPVTERRFRALSKLSKSLLAARDEFASEAIDETLKSVRTITRAEQRYRDLENFADQLSEIDPKIAFKVWEEALDAAREITNGKERVAALKRLAQIPSFTRNQGWTNLLEDSLTLARQIAEPLSRSDVLAQVAGTLARLRDQRAGSVLAEALDTKRFSRDQSQFSTALGEIVQILIDSGCSQEAMHISELIPSEAIRAESKSRIGLALAQAKRFEAAVSLAAEIPKLQDQIRSEIVRAHLEAREFDKALRIAGALEDEKKRGTEQVRIVQALAGAKQFKKALDTARSITLDINRIGLLGFLGSARISSNRREATRILNEALREAKQKLSVEKRAAALVTLLDPLHKLNPEKASEVVDEILEFSEDSDDRVSTLCKLGTWLEQDGDDRASEALEQAVEAAHELPTGDDLQALMEIGVSMKDADIGNANDVFEEALSLAARLYEDEGEELIDFIDKFLERCDADEFCQSILDAAQQMADDYERTEVLMKLAKSLAEMCLEEEVEDVVMSVDDESERRFVQAEIDATYVKNRVDFKIFDSDTWKIAENIEFEEPRNTAFDYMGSKLADKVNCNEALKIIHQANNPVFLRRAVPGVIRALVRANRLEEAIEAARPDGLAASLSDEQEELILARNEVAERLAAEGKFRQAFGLVTSRDLDRSIGALAAWSPALDQCEPGFGARMVAKVSRIAGWARSDWRDVHDILSSSENARSLR